MSRILLVPPPYDCWGVQIIGTWPPLQLAYLGGAAEAAGHEVRLYDAMSQDSDFEGVRSAVKDYQPDVVVAFDYMPVTGAVSTATVPAALEALAVAKSVDPDIVTVIGGPHPTFLYEETLQDNADSLDFILRGEAEETIPELLSALPDGDLDDVRGIAFIRSGEVIATPMRPHIANLNDVKPAWHLLDWELYHYNIEPWGRMASILTSRGCMMGCSFCSHRQFWRGDWRARDPQNAIEEIRELVDNYDVEFITMIDPYPTNDRERWEELLDLLIAEDMDVRFLMETRVEDIVRDEAILPKYRQAGIVHIYVGAEATDQETLDQINKEISLEESRRAIQLIAEHDMISETSFVLGFPDETQESIDRTLKAAREFNPDFAHFLAITPWPYADLWDEYQEYIEDFDYRNYNLIEPVIKPKAMSRKEIDMAIITCYGKFYMPKMKEFMTVKSKFRRDYLLRSTKMIMQSSFLVKKFARLGIDPRKAMKDVMGR